ncbi:MAG: FAD-dependent oxidoreductase, partial [Syntrophorhabdaceae bacterium]|nr:FAD-dependent oxidoreductase [Syntrophorhabdaceae bacterium]
MRDKKPYCDVLIIGSGIAGLSTAINLCESGLNIILINKAKNIEESNTLYAQGGIVTLGKNDSPELLAQDIIDAGDGISNPLAVELVTKEGTKLVRDFLIKKVSVQFSKSSEKGYDYAQE